MTCSSSLYIQGTNLEGTLTRGQAALRHAVARLRHGWEPDAAFPVSNLRSSLNVCKRFPLARFICASMNLTNFIRAGLQVTVPLHAAFRMVPRRFATRRHILQNTNDLGGLPGNCSETVSWLPVATSEARLAGCRFWMTSSSACRSAFAGCAHQPGEGVA